MADGGGKGSWGPGIWGLGGWVGSKSGLRSESRGWKPLERAGLWSSGLAKGGVVSEDTGGLGVSLGSAIQELRDLSSQMSSLGGWGEIAQLPSQDVERIQRGTPASLLPYQPGDERGCRLTSKGPRLCPHGSKSGGLGAGGGRPPRGPGRAGLVVPSGAAGLTTCGSILAASRSRPWCWAGSPPGAPALGRLDQLPYWDRADRGSLPGPSASWGREPLWPYLQAVPPESRPRECWV